jgi:hypothetical protein
MGVRLILQLFSSVLFSIIPAMVVGCADSESAVTPGQFSKAEFESLRWLEGDWEGSGGLRPFFEGYEFSNDTTILIHYYADSTKTDERGRGSLYLSQGAIYHEADGGTWAAVRIDSSGIHFAPWESATNSFQISPTSWEAVLWVEDGSESRYELRRTGG